MAWQARRAQEPGPGPATDRQHRVGLRDLAPYLAGQRRPLIAVAVLALVGSAAALAQPLLTRRVLQAVQGHRGVAGPVLAVVALVLGDALIDGVRRYLLQRSAEGVVLRARTTLAAHLLRLPVAEYDRRRTGDLLSRVGADTTLLRAVVTGGLFEVSSGALLVVGAVVAMALLDLLLLAVTLVSLVAGLLAVVSVSRRVRDLTEQAQERVGAMTSAVERALSATRTIRAAGAEDREAAGVADSAMGAYAAGLRAARLEALVAPAAGIAVQGSFVLVLAVGGARVARGDLTVADLIAFVLYLFLLVLPLAQALQAFTTLQTGLGALQRVQDALALPDERAGDATVLPAVRSVAPLVELVGVSFGYGGVDGGPGREVLRDVSFAVPRGARVALVGPSGAGKSTVLALLERFYDATAGSVRVGGVDVRDWPRAALRAQIGYVEQEAPVLAGTLRSNLLLAAPGASEEQLQAVVDAVALRTVVERAPFGLDSEVGDGGVLLSGGERQRVALGRVLLAAPPLLLLDEPTSNLDARNELLLRRAVDAVARDRTLLVVAHRLSTVVDADAICVLDDGELVAVGTHAELVETSPLYRELASSQLLVAPA